MKRNLLFQNFLHEKGIISTQPINNCVIFHGEELFKWPTGQRILCCQSWYELIFSLGIDDSSFVMKAQLSFHLYTLNDHVWPISMNDARIAWCWGEHQSLPRVSTVNRRSVYYTNLIVRIILLLVPLAIFARNVWRLQRGKWIKNFWRFSDAFAARNKDIYIGKEVMNRWKSGNRFSLKCIGWRWCFAWRLPESRRLPATCNFALLKMTMAFVPI